MPRIIGRPVLAPEWPPDEHEAHIACLFCGEVYGSYVRALECEFTHIRENERLLQRTNIADYNWPNGKGGVFA